MQEPFSRGPSEPSDGFAAVAALHRLAERLEAAVVSRARADGWSWQDIGEALGITRQSAFTKHGNR